MLKRIIVGEKETRIEMQTILEPEGFRTKPESAL